MRRIFSIFFLTIYLISTTELYQFLKVPALIEHYAEKKAGDPGLTIGEFMTDHYRKNHFVNHPIGHDYAQDMKLPFVLHSKMLKPLFLSYQFSSFTISEPETVPVRQHQRLTDDPFISSDYLSSIWRPPRIC